MPVIPSEVQWYLSDPNTGLGFTGNGLAGQSLGRFMSTTQVNSAQPLDDLFLDITPAQNAGGQVDYQCVFLMNNTVTGLMMKNPYVWMPSALWTYNGAMLAVGLDPTGVVTYNSASVQAVTIATSLNAPAGVNTWIQQPLSLWTAGLKLPDIPPQYCVAIWIQRTATNSKVLTPQSLELACTYTSNA